MVRPFNPDQLTLSEITKIQERVSGMFGMPATLDQTVSFIENNSDLVPVMLGASKSSETVSTTLTKLPLKQKVSKSIAKKPLNWKGFDFDRFLDGEVHIPPKKFVTSLVGARQ